MITPYSNIISVTTLAPNLLLDTYSGAAAAYSLRGLNTEYVNGLNPYAVTVRNGAGDHANIGFVFNSLTGDYDLDVDALLAHCAGSNGFVADWYDQSGNGRDATQTTAANQPQIVSSGSVITENGKPSVQFIRLSQQELITINTLELGTSNRGEFLVGSSTTPLISSCFYYYGNEGDGHSWVHTPETAIRINNGNNIWLNSPHTSQNLAYIEYLGTTTDDIDLYLNSALQTPTSTLSLSINSTNNTLSIGGYYNGTLDGKIQELILYPSDQSSNRTGIETNINDFYSIY